MLKDINKATILFSAIFLILGYLLGHCEDCGNSGCDDRGASCHYTQCDKSSSCDKSSKCDKSKCNKGKKGDKCCKSKGAHGEHHGVWVSEDGDVEGEGEVPAPPPVTEEHEHGDGHHSHN
jgi:hypothetical protein